MTANIVLLAYLYVWDTPGNVSMRAIAQKYDEGVLVFEEKDFSVIKVNGTTVEIPTEFRDEMFTKQTP